MPARPGNRHPCRCLPPDPSGHRQPLRRGADFTINGFRNLQEKLYPAAARDAAETKRRTHRTSRLIAKLRGHGLITRVKNSRLYRLTTKGFKAMWPAVRFRRIDFPTAFRAAQAA